MVLVTECVSRWPRRRPPAPKLLRVTRLHPPIRSAAHRRRQPPCRPVTPPPTCVIRLPVPRIPPKLESLSLTLRVPVRLTPISVRRWCWVNPCLYRCPRPVNECLNRPPGSPQLLDRTVRLVTLRLTLMDPFADLKAAVLNVIRSAVLKALLVPPRTIISPTPLPM